MDIKVETKVNIKVGDTKINLARESAEQLYDQLGIALGYEEEEEASPWFPPTTSYTYCNCKVGKQPLTAD